ncbi:hypothetical protein [Sporomusa malonica]|uniref:hypothetical protein n=1 Tax=Sporomusa malonica TaxID=112901 RepID=UPI0009FBCEB0|nr:hypothetical protein [Sporomusa malonica]
MPNVKKESVSKQEFRDKENTTCDEPLATAEAFTKDKYTHDTAKMQEGIAEKLSEIWSRKSAEK